MARISHPPSSHLRLLRSPLHVVSHAMIAPPSGGSQAVTIFGKRYVRTTGSPNQYTDTFTLPPGITTPFNMHIQSGDASGGKISSGTVILNGTQIVGVSDFSQQVSSLDRSVSLLTSNVLQVTVASKPGSFLIISFTGQAVPVANAGPAQSVVAGTTVHLDGTASTDADGDPLTYQWTFTSIPSGSSASLTGATTPTPSFVADRPGNFTVQLIVSDGIQNSAPSTVTITTTNSPPVANAGPNQTVTTQTTVQLDASKSHDVDGDQITYRWTLSTPPNSHATLSDATVVNPTLVTDQKGTYTAQLIVNDGIFDSAPSTVTINDQNSPPIANPGPAQSITVGQTVQLDGSGSTDVDGDRLTYSWSILSAPSGSTAQLSSATAAQPTFVADLVGTYVVQLIVNDGTVNGTPATVTITTSDVPPIANPGPAQSVPLGALVNLDGTGSTDSDHQPLTYQWSLTSKPANSNAVLSGAISATPSFVSDKAGNYVVQLIVNDGFLNSQPATVMISTINSVPVANAGSNQTVFTGTTVQLSGAASSDADGDPLMYRWAILSAPTASAAMLQNAAAISPSFVPDIPGLYVIQLIVNDGKVDSPPVTMTVTANNPNQPPVVNAGPNQTAQLIASSVSVSLNGTATDDGLPNGTLVVTWAQVSGPAAATFSSPNTASTEATFSAAGTYDLRLTANDSQLTRSSDVIVTVVQNQPPVVSAGPDQTIQLPTTSTTLNGVATDDGFPNGTLAIAWTQLAGPSGVVFASPNQPVTQATFPSAGVYLLQLSANDSQFTATSTVRVIVSNGNNLPPTVNAGANQSLVLPSNTLNLNGIAVDDGLPNGTLGVSWSEVAGPVAVQFSAPAQAVTQATFFAPGTYVLRLTASDSQLTSTSDVTVQVFASRGGSNQAPYVNAGPDQLVILPGSANLNGVAVDDGLPNGTLTIKWEKISGPGNVTFANSSFPSTFATFDLPGTYVLRLSASDSALLSSSQVTVRVLSLNGARSNKGTDFWLMFPTNYSGGTPSELDLYISADTATNGVVSIPGLAFSQNFSVTAGGMVTVTVPPAALVTNPDIVENKGIHVTSQLPVAVYGMNLVSASTDGYLALPTTMLGTQYYAMSYINEYPCGGSCFLTQYGTQFAIVAVSDGTNVTITPSADTEGHPAGVPYTIVLNQGRTYELQNFDTGDVDLTGSLISSDKPISLFGGHYCANVGYAGACNHLVEQLPPVENWGKTFVVQPFATRIGGDIVRVLGSVDGTNITINGTVQATVNHGEFYQFNLTHAVEITTDQPVLVAQFAHSIQVDGINATNGDPTMVVVPPVEQFGSNYTITTPAVQFTDNQLNITAPAAAVGAINLDSSPIPASAFQPIGSGRFVGARIAVSVGAHHLSGSMPFGAIVYGFASYDAYSYAAGQSLGSVPNATITLEPKSLTQQTGTQHCAIATIRNSLGVAMGGITATFVVSGANSANGLATTDFSGHAEYCYSGANNGSDTILASVGETQDTASITWSANAGNQTPFVDAGSAQTVTFPGPVTLAGIATDDTLPANVANTLQWTQVSGPGTTTFNPATSGYTTATFSAPGTYALQLAANDTQLTGSSTVSVTVNAAPQNQAPVVNAGANQTLQLGQSTDGMVTLSGTASDDGLPAGAGLMLTWSYVGCTSGYCGYQPVIVNPQSATTKVFFDPIRAGAAVYTFKLTADDSQLTSSSTVTITVLAANKAPQISYSSVPSNQTITLPTNTISINATVTDDGLPAGAPVTSSWTQTGGPAPVVFSNPNQPSTQITFSAPGTYYVTLTASDTQYDTQQSIQLFVKPANQPPTISVSASPTTIALPTNTLNLNATVQDDGLPSNTINVTWTQTSGPAPATIATPNAVTTPVTFTAPGSYSFLGTASDTQLSASATVYVTVSPQNQPPQVNAGPNQTVALPTNTVTLSGTVSDDGLPAGSHLAISWSQVSGPGTVTFSNPSAAVTQATFSIDGTYELRLSASDTQITSYADCIVTVYPAPQNQPPKVFAGVNQTVTLPNPLSSNQASVFLQGQVSDDGLPTGSRVTQSWSLVSGPQGASVAFSNPTGPATYASFTVPGTYVLQLSATDTQLTSTSQVTVLVNPPVNLPPTIRVSNTGAVVLPSAGTLSATVSDDGLPAGSSIAVQWTQVSGPAAATIATPNQSTSSVSFTVAGSYAFQITATDSQLTSSTIIGLVVQPANQAPVVNVGPNQEIQLPSNTVTLSGAATDDGLPSGTLTYLWTQTGGPAQATIANPTSLTTQVTLPATGELTSTYTFNLTVSDGQLSTSSHMSVTVEPPSPPPTVQLLTPADGDEITKPTAVTANIFPETAGYTLEYSLHVGDAPGTFVQFASTNSRFDTTNPVLGTFDPTTLANGIYTIRLTVQNVYGQTAQASTVVNVTRNQKLGVLALSFNDLTVPVAGLPIQIIRSYSSLDSSDHEFGRGWNLSIANVRLQKNRALAKNWVESYDGTSFFPSYCLQPVNDRIVTITFPDNKVYRFLAGSSPSCQVAGPITAPTLSFQELPGAAGTAGATLVAADGGQMLLDGAVPGNVNLTDYSGNPYNPTVFVLTTADGTQYTIDQTLGVTKMVDANGNWLSINSNGIVSSTGKSVVFKRNAQNLITEIDDPDGNAIKYGYNGDVLSTFTDATGKNTTNFAWDLGGNRLAGILPPGATSYIGFSFDHGRLSSANDPLTGNVHYGYDTTHNTQTVTDRNNNVTTYQYDDDGNILSVTDALGHTTSSTYDANDNKLSDTNALGKTTTYTTTAWATRRARPTRLGIRRPTPTTAENNC